MRASLRSRLQHAPVHDPRRTRHVPGLRARKKCNHSGDFASIAGSTERDAEPLLVPRVLVLLASYRRSDLAGCDGVRGDVVLTELECEGLDQSANTVLGRVVRAEMSCLMYSPPPCTANRCCRRAAGRPRLAAPVWSF